MRKTRPILLPEQSDGNHETRDDDDDVDEDDEDVQIIDYSLSVSANDNANHSVGDTNVDSQQSSALLSNEHLNNFDVSSHSLGHNGNSQQYQIGGTNSHLFDEHSYESHNTALASHTDETQSPELNSLNNEFLNTILATQYQSTAAEPSAGVSDATNCMNNDTVDDLTRPRQLGRRSEARSRIVSITAERNAEGSQVIRFTSYIQSIRKHK